MTKASRIVLTKGEIVDPAPEGMSYLSLDTNGILIRVDDNGVQHIVGRDGTQIPSLSSLPDVSIEDASIGDILTKTETGFKLLPPIQGEKPEHE